MTGIAIRVTAGSTIIQATIEVPSLGFSRTVMLALGGGLAQLSAIAAIASSTSCLTTVLDCYESSSELHRD